jgi:hypothetical protein
MDNKGEELNSADDLAEVKGDLEELVNDRHPDLGYVNQAGGSTSRTLNQPTKEELVEELNRLKALANPGEEVTFYYVGHGGGGPDYGLLNTSDEAGEKYDEWIWINDANGDKVADWNETLADNELAQMLQGFREGVTLVVFMDSCFAGGFTGAPGDIQESKSVAVIGSSGTCAVDKAHGFAVEVKGVTLVSGDWFGVRFATSLISGFGATIETMSEEFADGAGEREADANEDGIVTADELKAYLKWGPFGFELGPPDDASPSGSSKKPKSGGSWCVGRTGPCNLPDVSIDPDGARAGFLPVRGDHFPTSSEVKLDLVTSEGSQVSSSRSLTDASGTFRGHVPISGIVSGTYMLTAMSNDGFSDHLFLNIVDEETGAETANAGLNLPYRMLTGLLDNVPSVNSYGLLPGVQGGGLEVLNMRTGAVDLPLAPGGGTRGADDSEPMIYIEALGGPTGEVYEVTIVGDAPVDLNGYAAIEPVAVSSREREEIVEQLEEAPGPRRTFKANGYCRDFLIAPPPAGAVFRLADAAEQAEFEPQARVLEAARRLYEENLLNVDSDPEGYFHSIRQWALWTVTEGFDQEEFLSAFSKQVRENLEGRGTAWTDPVAAAVRQHAESRWGDIQQVLERAQGS